MVDVLLFSGASFLALLGVYILWRRSPWPEGWPVTGEPVILGLLGLLIYLAFLATGSWTSNYLSEDLATMHLAVGGIRFFFIAVFYWIVRTMVHEEDPMRSTLPRSRRDVSLVFLPYLLILPLMYLVTPESDQQAILDLQALVGFLPKAYLFVGIVIAAPLFEELLFRGFLQGAMRRAFPPGVSILVVSMLFAFVHEPGVRVPVFCLGLFLGVVYEKSRGFWAPWFVHTLHNLITYVFVVSGAADA